MGNWFQVYSTCLESSILPSLHPLAKCTPQTGEIFKKRPIFRSGGPRLRNTKCLFEYIFIFCQTIIQSLAPAPTPAPGQSMGMLSCIPSTLFKAPLHHVTACPYGQHGLFSSSFPPHFLSCFWGLQIAYPVVFLLSANKTVLQLPFDSVLKLFY